MRVHPLSNDVRDLGDLLAHDEPQPRPGQCPKVAIRQHARIRGHGHIRKPVRGLECLGRRDDRGRFRLVALERLHHQWEPTRIRQQADGDPGLQSSLFVVPGLAGPVPGISLKVERRGCRRALAWLGPVPHDGRTQPRDVDATGLSRSLAGDAGSCGTPEVPHPPRREPRSCRACWSARSAGPAPTPGTPHHRHLHELKPSWSYTSHNPSHSRLALLEMIGRAT